MKRDDFPEVSERKRKTGAALMVALIQCLCAALALYLILRTLSLGQRLACVYERRYGDRAAD